MSICASTGNQNIVFGPFIDTESFNIQSGKMSTGTTYTQQGLLHQMFSRQAKATPENVAVVEESGKDIKFRNLDENSDKLGKHLVYNGVTPNACVGIYLDKSIEYTTAYIAILKAGAAYLPLDVAYPQSMLKSVLEDAKPKAVITVKDLAHNLAGYDSIIVLEEEWETTIVTGEVTLPTELTLDNLAYIVYSSGTTGKPKGVICPHRGAVFSYHWRHEAYPFQEGERVACNIFFSWEMLRPLLKGVTMYIISNTTIYDPPLLSQYIHNNKITQILFTPSLLEAVLNTPGLDLQQLRSLRQIWFCGEVVTTALFERCLKLLPWIQFLNLYSISECHDAACEDLNLYFKENMFLTENTICTNTRHSLLATELMMNLRQMFDVDLNVRDLFTYPTITTLSQFIEAKKNKRTEELHTIPKVIDMQLRAFWRTFNLSNERRFKIGRVLLTGATGFLGAFLLREILLQTKCMIKCLVRELPDTTPNQRLEKSLQQFGVLPSDGKPSEQQTLIQSMYTKRVEIIKGDVALINMGMNEDDYTYLCTDIDFIIHAAAYVNLVYPYEAFTGPNVTGTRNVVMFSCTGKIKPIHYISTDAVFPNGMKNCSEDDNIEDNHTELNDGYSQSKWVAEQLISRAGQKGLPVVIYRLGNMSGDRKQAFWNPLDFTLLVLQACAKYGYAPDVDWDMEMTPVDFAAEFIVRCTFNLSTILGRPTTLSMTNHYIQEESQKNGSNGSFTASIQRLLESYLTSPDFFSNLSTYKTDNLKQTLELLNMSYPYTSSKMLKTITSKNYLSVKSFFPLNDRLHIRNRKLEGKIAIVTGASSGIGRAIAVALCQAGAKVALAARRMERLEEINREITDQEGICICVKTDVTKREDVKELVKHTESVFGPVDILVNNAGVMYYLHVTFQVKELVKHTESVFGPVDILVNNAGVKELVKHTESVFGPVDILVNNAGVKELVKHTESVFGPVDILVNNASVKELVKHTESVFGPVDILVNNAGVMYYLHVTFQVKELVKHTESVFGPVDILVNNAGVMYYLHVTFQVKELVKHTESVFGPVDILVNNAGVMYYTMMKNLNVTFQVKELVKHTESVFGPIDILVNNACVMYYTLMKKLHVTFQVKELVKHTESVFGPVDILVNNAGVMYYTMMKNLHEDEWEGDRLTLIGLTNCIGGVLDGMLKRGSGHIVNMSSDAGRKGFPGLAVYSGTKFYVEGLSQALRQEVCGSGVRVTCIQPGDVKTELISHSTDKEAQEKYDGSSSCKILEPTDIANAVLYAVTQPEYVGVNEILVEPREAPA
ncbi:unnamed protein product [Mytilus edulis]|uniref:Fatty acyl-CoA reductase n=1 Tax=Mytilus edulis TaxID=6550 RepID=A0A8S3U0T9_MYTED|nr:unnamed protein product [Mytilus edulis]